MCNYLPQDTYYNLQQYEVRIQAVRRKNSQKGVAYVSNGIIEYTLGWAVERRGMTLDKDLSIALEKKEP